MKLSAYVIKSGIGNSGLSSFSQGIKLRSFSDEFSAALVSNLKPRYSSLVEAGCVFGGLSSAQLAAPSSTSFGPALINLSESGKNLVLLDVAMGVIGAPSATPAVCVPGLIPIPNLSSPSLQITPLPEQAVCLYTGANTVDGGGNTSSESIAVLGSATLLTGLPTRAVRIFVPFYFDKTTTTFLDGIDDIGGAIIIGPGSAISIADMATTVENFNVGFSFTWAELPT